MVMKTFKRVFLNNPKSISFSASDYFANSLAHLKMGYYYLRHKTYNHYYNFIESKII